MANNMSTPPFDAFDALVDAVNKLSSNTNATVFDIAKARSDLEKILRDFPIEETKELRQLFSSEIGELGGALDNLVDSFEEQVGNIEDYNKRLEDHNKKIEILTDQLERAAEEDKQFYQDKLNKENEQFEADKAQQQAHREGREFEYQLEQELAAKHRRDEEEAEAKRKADGERRKQEEEAAFQRLVAKRDKQVDKITSLFNELSKYAVDLLKSSVNSIASSYEQHAGTLAAALDSSVDDIGNLQRKIANELRDTSLNEAISNIAVMTEAANLVKSGYTNEDKLQASATAIATGKELAPSLNFDTSTVKNLTNIFGSDFIDRFSAIQVAVQDTAGSTININSNLTKMMSDLEPVYQNAEYQITALQDTADIEATLSAAQDAGIITEAQSKEYLTMIAELMDPSKAFKSKSTAVRAAATMYDFGSGSPMEALQALLSARGQMYGSIDQSSSYMGNMSRSLAASAFGDDTMSATYSGSGLYGLDILYTDNLDQVYQNQRSKLQSGEYTTTKESEENKIANSSIAQGIAKIQENFPIMFGAFSGKLFTQLSMLPTRIAAAIKRTNIGLGGTTGSGDDVVDDVINSSPTTGGGSYTGFLNGLRNSNFANRSLIGLGSTGSRLGQLTSGFTASAVGGGILGAINLIGQWDSDRSFVQNAGFGGDIGNSMLSWTGMGAGTGALIGSVIPGLGNVLGGLIGGAVGLVGGLISAIVAGNEIEEENTRAIEEQKEAVLANTKSLLGEGVTSVDALEAKREVARGGGIVHLKSGDYKIAYPTSTPGYASGLDYVPYDEYSALLHKGEAVVTADAAKSLREQNPNFWNTPLRMNEDSNISSTFERQTDRIVSAIKGEDKYSPLSSGLKGPKQYTIVNDFA